VTFGYLWTLYIRVCGINDHGHTCDEYLVLFTKSGMTSTHWPSPPLSCLMPLRRHCQCSPSNALPWPHGQLTPEPPCALRIWKWSKLSRTPPRAVEFGLKIELVLSLSESKPNRLNRNWICGKAGWRNPLSTRRRTRLYKLPPCDYFGLQEPSRRLCPSHRHHRTTIAPPEPRRLDAEQEGVVPPL
jgi:hypothetical protein